jgi:hypothetical protein
MHTKYVFVGYEIVFEMHRLISGLKNTATGQLFFSAAYSEPSSSLLRLRFPKLHLAFKFLFSRIQSTATDQRIFCAAYSEPSYQFTFFPKLYHASKFLLFKASEG